MQEKLTVNYFGSHTHKYLSPNQSQSTLRRSTLLVIEKSIAQSTKMRMNIIINFS